MGLFEKIRAEFIDIVEWREQEPGVLVHRFERHDHEIKMGAQLTVRPGQRAVFVNEGQVADVFEAGRHTLATENLPLLATLKGWKYGFHSPFKAEVYFLNATEQLDRKWGTATPVILRDADFGMVRVRARGNFSYKLGADREMISRLVGARQAYRAEEIEGQLRAKVVSSFTDALGELKIPVLDLQAQYDEVGGAMKEKLARFFEGLGLELLGFVLENVTVPEEVEKAMDQRASMGAVGNLNQFAQYQAAQALRDAAGNPGSAGNMMGMMVGGQLASGLGDVLRQGGSAAPSAGAAASLPGPAAGAGGTCAKCRAAVAAGAKFCGECGAPQRAACEKCGGGLAAGAKFCGECGAQQGAGA